MIMDREMKTDKKGAKAQTRFVVTREFGGTQTMQEACNGKGAGKQPEPYAGDSGANQ